MVRRFLLLLFLLVLCSWAQSAAEAAPNIVLIIPEHHIPYYASISQFNDTVGQLVRPIERRGLAQRTLMRCVVDNGWKPSKRPGGQKAASPPGCLADS